MIYVCCSSASLREVQVLDERGRETEIESERLTNRKGEKDSEAGRVKERKSRRDLC